MKLYSVTDGYIDFLRSAYKHVYSNKELERQNTRKYLGIVLTIDKYNYYIPLSSAKEKDYIVVNGRRIIKKDTFFIFRIVSNKCGRDELKATIRFANMIPVPDNELIQYDINNEPDEDYRSLVREELEYIRKNETTIIRRARVIYKNKTQGNTENVYTKCLDFNGLEKMCDIWVKNINQHK